MAGEGVPGPRYHRVLRPAAMPAFRRVPARASRGVQYQAPDFPSEQPAGPTTLRAVEHGPFLVRGDLQIHTTGGLVTDTRAALCRCTRSARQPFCDAACEAPGPSSLSG